jgi:hypothetical protein
MERGVVDGAVAMRAMIVAAARDRRGTGSSFYGGNPHLTSDVNHAQSHSTTTQQHRNVFSAS